MNNIFSHQLSTFSTLYHLNLYSIYPVMKTIDSYKQLGWGSLPHSPHCWGGRRGDGTLLHKIMRPKYIKQYGNVTKNKKELSRESREKKTKCG